MKIITLIFFMLTYATTGFAHSPLKETTPRDGSIIERAPEVLALTFAQPVRLTKVKLIHEKDASSQPIDIEITEKAFAETIKLFPEWQGKGDYQVEWRALASDGHSINGSFGFSITSE